MHIPKVWKLVKENKIVKGEETELLAWGYSEGDEAEAIQKGQEKIARIAHFLNDGNRPDVYEYYANAMREQIIEEALVKNEEQLVVLTRNGYGAVVLNSKNVMFLDIDSFPSGCALFGGGGDPKAKKKKEIIEFCEVNNLHSRLYETSRGFRVLVLNKLYEANSNEAQQLMKDLGCDPLYIKLCKSQKCFRARLSPKPFRLNFENPPMRYPLPDEMESYNAWLEEYDKRSKDYAICRLVEEIGHSTPGAEAKLVLGLHDKYCLRANNFELA